MKITNDNFFDIINDILFNESVQSLKYYKHHYGSTRLEHCLNVSYYSYLVCKFFKLDYISAGRAGLLHDLFFYSTNTSEKPKFHLWKHPKIALKNAQQLFSINQKERDIILKHMWPITLIPPRYLESYIITCVDKYCAFIEWINHCSFTINYYTKFYLHRNNF